jgi:cysteine-rich repeat protein
MLGSRSFLGVLAIAGCTPAGGAMTEGVGTSSGAEVGADATGTGGAAQTGGGEETSAAPTSGTTTLAIGDTEGTSGGGSSGSDGSSGLASSGSGSSGDVAPFCGDGSLDDGEGCDDGNVLADDGCSPDCVAGPGAERVVAVPLEEEESLSALALVDKQDLDGVSHGLVLGGSLWVGEPEPTEMHARVQQRPLQGGAQAWSWQQGAGIYGRQVFEIATAANGDVVVAGLIFTEFVKPDTGGYLWLARFSAGGELVWSVEDEEVTTEAYGLAVTSDDDIVLAGHTAGFSTGNLAHRFRGSDGQLMWSYQEAYAPTFASGYASVAIDEEDRVYIAGVRYDYAWPEPEWMRLFVRALDADGGERWTFEVPPEGPTNLRGMTLAVTGEQVVVAAVEQVDIEEPTRVLLTGLDFEGASLWSRWWAPPVPTAVTIWDSAAAPGGGVYVTGWTGNYETRRLLTGRFDAAGSPVWVNTNPVGWGLDVEVDPDGVAQVVIEGAVVAYAP